MNLQTFFNIWIKHQLSLNWLNIIFRYAVKLLLLFNLVIAVIGITYKFKTSIIQFPYLFAGMAAVDLLLKLNLQKNRQYLKSFHLSPGGVQFLSKLNIVLDIFSPRNLILPLIALLVAATLEQDTAPLFSLLLVSCLNNLVAGFSNKTERYIAFAVEFLVILIVFSLTLTMTPTVISYIIAWSFVIFFRHREMTYPTTNGWNNRATKSVYHISNPFLRLDFLILKKSRHLQLAVLKVIAICLLYCYIISTKYPHQSEFHFDFILLVQIYYSLAPILLIPYILSSDYSYIGLLMTIPDTKTYFRTKLNILLLVQFVLTIVLYALNYHDLQALFLISSIFIFNVMVVTPLFTIGTLLTDEKVNVFNSGFNNFLFIPPFIQSIYFLIILITTGMFLYALYYAGFNIFSWSLLSLGLLAFIAREKFFTFFLAQFHDKKYKLFKILS